MDPRVFRALCRVLFLLPSRCTLEDWSKLHVEGVLDRAAPRPLPNAKGIDYLEGRVVLLHLRSTPFDIDPRSRKLPIFFFFFFFFSSILHSRTKQILLRISRRCFSLAFETALFLIKSCSAIRLSRDRTPPRRFRGFGFSDSLCSPPISAVSKRIRLYSTFPAGRVFFALPLCLSFSPPFSTLLHGSRIPSSQPRPDIRTKMTG